MDNGTSTRICYGGTNFCGMLFITFLVLKLTNVINWSWWWVTAPLWGPASLILLLGLIIGVIIFVIELCSSNKSDYDE